MYDLIIVGKGPAGWACAMTARNRGLDTLVVAPGGNGSLLGRAERIDNYPGMPGVSGQEMMESFARQALELGAKEQKGLVRQIMPNGSSFMLLVGNDVLEAKAVVLALGAVRASVFSGEDEHIGRGVSYCATCDGMLHKGKQVAVLSTSLQGLEEVQFLSTLASGIDYYRLKQHPVEGLPAPARLVEEVAKHIRRDGESMVLETDKGEHAYSGIFIFREAMAMKQLLPELTVNGGEIPVDRMMRTNVPGIFAAGDCTGKPLQIAKAVGEGNVAAIGVAEYIAQG